MFASAIIFIIKEKLKMANEMGDLLEAAQRILSGVSLNVGIS